jgi:hypothetical protein
MQRLSHNHLDHKCCKYSARLLGLSFERKTEDVLGKNQSGFRMGNGVSDKIGMLRIMSERTLDIDDEWFACFIDWQRYLTL